MKAVIPAAGLGTRFLPATKAQPKEMLPVFNKPTIQYVVEEAVASGIDDILIINGKGKRSIEDHFDRSFELEFFLKSCGKIDYLVEKNIKTEVNIKETELFAPFDYKIDNYETISRILIHDTQRNSLILRDIEENANRFKTILILTG